MRDLPIWLKLPSLVGLDAALVAMVWQRAMAARLELAIAPSTTVVLGLVVWGIYLVDRVGDGMGGSAATERHAFAGRHRHVLRLLAAGCGIGAVALLGRVPVDLQLGGAALALVVLGYLLVVHGVVRGGGPGRSGVAGAKEAVVGLCFGLGTMLPVVLARGGGEGGWVALGFGAACWCNCRLIDAWERSRRVPRLELAAMVATFVVAALAMPAACAPAIASLFVLFWGMDRLGARDAAAARSVVDVAMAIVGAMWWASA